MQKLWETTTQQLLSGIAPGVHRHVIPLWENGREINFNGMAVESAQPHEQLLTLDSDPLDMAQSFTIGRKRLYYATQSGYYRYIGPQTEYESVSQTQGITQLKSIGLSGQVILVPWGDWILATDGVNPPQLDKNTGTMSNLAGDFPYSYVRCMAKYQTHLFVANTNLNGRHVVWSDLDDPEKWTASLTNSAGSIPLRDLDARINAMIPIGSNLAVYSGDQMVVVRFIGGQYVFGSQPSLQGIGAFSQRSVIANNRFNWGLTRRGIFRTDGVSAEYIDEPLMRRWIRENVNFANYQRIYGYHDEANEQVCWAVPTLEGEWLTIGFSYRSGSWTLLNTGVQVANEAQVFDSAVLAYARQVSLVSTSGAREASWIETKPLHLGTADVEKTFQQIRIWGTSEGTCTVRAGYCTDIDDEPEYEHEWDFAHELPIPDGNRNANYIRLRFEAAEDSWFRIAGIEIHGEPGGFHK